MFYLIIFLIIALFSILEVLNFDKQISRSFSIIIILILLFIAGLRYETGVDWRVYESMFETTVPINEITNSLGRELIFSSPDYGYCLLISLIKYFGGSIQTVFFIVSLLTYFFLYKAIVFFSNGKAISLLVYFAVLFFVLDMSGMRQSLALSIFFYSIKYVYSKNRFKFVFLVLFAGSFHWSAYLLLFMYFIIRRTFSSKSLIVLFCISLLVYVLNVKWLNIIIDKVSPLMGDYAIATKLLFYSTYESSTLGRDLNLNTIVNIVFYIVTFFLIMYYRKDLEKSNKYFNIFLNIYICQIFTFFCMFEFIEMSERLRLYFMISNIIILPCLIYLFYLKAERILIFAYVFLFSFFSCKPYILNAETTISYHPYQNYIIYKGFNLNSTGEERLNKQAQLNE
ncbi:EpsG family protein [Flavobacterium sp. KACC 22758]|jgi:hypothetical protein|uniref:EpsG family protein n=1 Tax=Flavobacterium sp. KACC 22758 TaxID=3025667 RepID=UPI002366C5F7|nr:EpsG family protein [Flavobacterium sp. KACC 22758]WDF59113.1 EpsG family protein [Flavobacterium sp. KACC 22758]